MVAMHRPPELQEAFSVLEVLPFLRDSDRQRERLKLLELQALFQKQAGVRGMRSMRWMCYTIITCRNMA